MIKVGIIGCGFSAQTFHIPLIEASGHLDLTSIATSQFSTVTARYPGISVFHSADDLIKDGELDLVVITAPNEFHYSLAKSSLEQGLHVVLEKPMVTTSSEAAGLIEIARAKSLILSVFHNRRWDGDFLTVRKILENNAVGDIRIFESHFDRFRPVVRQRWREQPGPGAGVWFDLGSHLVDQTVCLFGLPESITARCLASRKDSETTDYFHVLLHYRDLEVILHASSFSAGPNIRFRVEGSKGSFVKQGLDPQEDQLKRGMMPTEAGFGVEEKEQFGFLYNETEYTQVETEVGCYQQYYSNLADAINLGSKCSVTAEEASSVMEILELAELSSRQGKTLELDRRRA